MGNFAGCAPSVAATPHVDGAFRETDRFALLAVRGCVVRVSTRGILSGDARGSESRERMGGKMMVTASVERSAMSLGAVLALLTCLGDNVAWPQPGVAIATSREVTVDAIPGVVAAGAIWQLVWQGTDNADGILGAADGGVLFAQEQPRRIAKLDLHGVYSIVLEDTRGVGSLAMTADGRLFGVERTCTDPGRRTGGECTEPTAISALLPQRRVLADAFAGEGLGRLNDLVVDRRGGAYFTVGGAYYADPSGAVTSLGDGMSTNGVMLSPDERTLYVTNREAVVAFDVAENGSTSNRRDFATLAAGGVGDGIAVDAAGRVYVTSAPGVQVFAASGEYLGVIPTPRAVISAAFAGPGKQWLYVVGGGAALGPNGTEFVTPEGVRNNAKSIYRVEMLAAGFAGRPK
jgi:gluconolactonase